VLEEGLITVWRRKFQFGVGVLALGNQGLCSPQAASKDAQVIGRPCQLCRVQVRVKRISFSSCRIGRTYVCIVYMSAYTEIPLLEVMFQHHKYHIHRPGQIKDNHAHMAELLLALFQNTERHALLNPVLSVDM
jgi:hypothetical protein